MTEWFDQKIKIAMIEFEGAALFFIALVFYGLLVSVLSKKILWLTVILPQLSCYWCQKKARILSRDMREMERQEIEARRNLGVPDDQNQVICVYTVERDANGRINYVPRPPAPAYQEKGKWTKEFLRAPGKDKNSISIPDDLPSYEEAIQHSSQCTQPPPETRQNVQPNTTSSSWFFAKKINLEIRLDKFPRVLHEFAGKICLFFKILW